VLLRQMLCEDFFGIGNVSARTRPQTSWVTAMHAMRVEFQSLHNPHLRFDDSVIGGEMPHGSTD